MTNDEIVVDVLNASYLLKDRSNEKDDPLERNQLLIRGKLTIPEYQRPYCWGEEQISSLIRDLEKHQEHDRNLRYYLGSIILHKQDGALNIIDGQQRVTTLALMMHVLGIDIDTSLSYASPISQMNIHKNIKWLKSNIEKLKKVVSFENIELSVVMTNSEDDAYRFFETQNTGGVRLSGADIIKAHHLRALKETHRGPYAKQWEKLGDINPIILTLLRGRFWQKLKYRDLPSHREVKTLKAAIIDEFAEKTGTGTDTAFARTKRVSDETGHFYQEHSHKSYDFRQPLNAGLNSINYLTYFQSLRVKYIECSEIPHLLAYKDFCQWTKKLKGSGYLNPLFEACIIMYVSQFGEYKLEYAAHQIFKVTFSIRMRNPKAVRENSIPKFINEYPVLDWIAGSYTPEQCLKQFEEFSLYLDPNNLGDSYSVKKEFLNQLNERFKLELTENEYAEKFTQSLSSKLAEFGN